MNKVIYLVRHCTAAGQAAAAELTPEGVEQADVLAGFLCGVGVGQIVSSPFARALETIKPLSVRLDIEISLDDRLIEAPLSTIDHPDWLEKLQETFSDFDLCFEGGESSRVATDRAIAAVNDAFISFTDPIAIVTHGRLLTLILKNFDPTYGFETWRNLTTPDVFRVVIKGSRAQVDRMLC